MATITIRDLNEGLERKLRSRAARNGRSIAEEARNILRIALSQEPSVGQETTPQQGLASAIKARFAPLGGVELDIPPRSPAPRAQRS